MSDKKKKRVPRAIKGLRLLRAMQQGKPIKSRLKFKKPSNKA